MPTPLKILLVEDNPDDAELVVGELRRAGFEPACQRVTTEAAFLAGLQPDLDLVLADFSLQQFSCVRALELLHQRGRDIPFIVLSGTGGEESAVATMRVGANDYVMKDRLARLKPAIDRALEEGQLRREQAQVAAALKQTERQHRNIIEHMRAGVLQVTPEGRIILVNPAFARILGYDSVEQFRREVPDVISLYVDPTRRDELRARLRETGVVTDFEILMRHRDGRQILVAHNIQVIRDELGAVHFEGTAEDVTERKQASETLRLQSSALAATANAIVITDRNGAIEWVNPAFTRLTGYSLTEAVGKNPRDLVKSGQQEEKVYEEMWSTILAGRTWHGQLVNRRKDGTLYPEEQTITPVCAPTGEITHFIAIKQDLTERRRAEAALQREQALLSSLISTIPDHIYFKDRQCRFVRINDSMAKRIGLGDPAEAIGKNDFDFFTEEHARPASEADERLLKSGQAIVNLEEKETWADGEVTWASTTKVVLRDAEGAITGLVGISRNITEHKRAEELRQSSEERYRLLFERSPDAIFVLTSTGVIKSLNPACERITGWRPAQWLGRPFVEILHADDQARLGGLFQQLWRDGRTVKFEGRVRTATGEFRDLEVTGFLSQLSDGTVEVQGIGRDVTERNLAERQVREQNEILSRSREGVMIVNLANTISFWNHGAEEIFGWTAAEALGRNPAQLMGVDDSGAVTTLLKGVERDGYWNGELRAQARDGRKLIVEVRVTQVRDEAGRPRARLNFLADITEKKLLEEKFLHAQRLESIGMLAAGITHDLNNVLGPILFAAPLLRGSVSSPRDLNILDVLQQSAERGAALVKQILGFAHSTTGELKSTQVRHLARDVVSVLDQTFPKSIQLEHHFPADLWPVLGNATQIHQVLLNLCVNARDAMPDGGVLRINLSNRRLDADEAGRMPGARPGTWIVMEVADSGSGIPPEVLARIWEPFFTTKGVGKGTGLGLSTVRGIVASHHGFLELSTAVGRGTTFRVFLPAADAAVVKGRTAAPFEIPQAQGEMILVVDDDTAVRNLVAQILQQHGYRVIKSVDGVDAITQFNANQESIVLVVSDVDMPRLGGPALAHAIKQIQPSVRLLAISGLSREDNKGSAEVSRPEVFDAYLPKPFAAPELLRAVHLLLT